MTMTTLEAVCESIRYGYTESANIEPIGPHFLRITDIVPSSIDWATVPYCTINDTEREKYALRPGDIVVARTGATVGYAKLIRNPVNAVFASYLVRFRVDRDKAEPGYVGRIVESVTYKEFVWSRINGAAQPNASAPVLGAFPFRLPSRDEQKRIVESLSNYDDLIATNQRRITLLEDAARRLYREWFVHLRFPGHESVPVKDGEPEGWSIQNLSSVAEVNARSIGTKDRPDEILYIDISSVTPGVIGAVTPYAFSDAPGRARRRVSHGDVIWSCVRPNRRSYALIWEPEENLVASTGFAVLSSSRVPFSYLYFATTTDGFVGYLEKNATGAAYPAVTAKTFEEAEIVVPDPDTLASFDELVLPMLAQMEILKTQNRELARAHDLLLPKLMSGQLDVSGIPLPEEIAA